LILGQFAADSLPVLCSVGLNFALSQLTFCVFNQLLPAIAGECLEPSPKTTLPMPLKKLDLAQHTQQCLLKYIMHGTWLDPPIFEPNKKKPRVALNKARPSLTTIA
jgi:hypothetical protein